MIVSDGKIVWKAKKTTYTKPKKTVYYVKKKVKGLVKRALLEFSVQGIGLLTKTNAVVHPGFGRPDKGLCTVTKQEEGRQGGHLAVLLDADGPGIAVDPADQDGQCQYADECCDQKRRFAELSDRKNAQHVRSLPTSYDA